METTERLNKNRLSLKIIILFLFSLIICLGAITFGSIKISFSDVVNFLIGGNLSQTELFTILSLRFSRVLLAFSVGAGLSVTGAVFQSILMNPLAEPYILGVSSGGTFGAILAIFLGLSFWLVTAFAGIGSIVIIFLVFVLGSRFGELEPNILLLTGIMISAFFSALILLLITLLNDSLRTAIFWMIGNLANADPNTVVFIFPITCVLSFILSLFAQKYNVLSLGNENALVLGINTKFVKNFSYIVSSLLIGFIVSISGIIGFVGLIIPHICRMLFGNDNRIIIPTSFFIGGMYLVIADTIARTIMLPAEIPVGAITALVGAPVFIYLLRKKFYEI
ncbi:MAG: iron ABC transporter permease [bacterium]